MFLCKRAWVCVVDMCHWPDFRAIWNGVWGRVGRAMGTGGERTYTESVCMGEEARDVADRLQVGWPPVVCACH